MKPCFLFALVAAMSASPGRASLAAQTSVQAGLGGGLSLPVGATSRGLNSGWNLLALVEVLPRAGHLGLRADVGLHRLGFEGGGGNTQILAATANGVYHLTPDPSAPARPYLLGGIGAFRFKTNSDFVPVPPETKVGLALGGGVEFGGLGTVLFVEARLHNVFVPSSDFRFLAVTGGLRLGGTRH